MSPRGCAWWAPSWCRYTESGNLGTDLDRFQKTNDGHLDNVHARRDALGADVMVFVVGDAAGGACGIGYVMTSLSSSFAPWAFSVTAYPCISPNYTFGHEIGHNMGSAHAPEDGASQPSLYPYSFGYKNPSNLFRTVMAYNCAAGCPRVLHFSNPGVSYQGATTGSVAQHNNAQSINNAASTMANFRQTVGGGTAPTISAISNVTIAEDGVTAPIAFTVGDAETAAGSLVVTATSTNTTLVPNTVAALALGGSGATRTLTVRPAANQAGSASITVTVNDGSRTATRTFTLTVTAVNDAPTVARTPAAATITSGGAAQTSVVVTDIDTAGSALALSTSSSNTVLLPNANVALAITTTTATSRTYQVTMTSVAGQSGSSTVTLTGSDGSLSAGTTFVLTVGVPAPPSVGAINGQAMSEDGSLAVPFTVADADTALSSLTVQASSSNPTLVSAGGLVVSGTSGSRALTITPAANQSGSATVTVAVSDGSTTATRAFELTVNAVNDLPAYGGVPASVSTMMSTPTSFQVTVSDVETAGASLALSGTTTNAAVLSNAGIVISPLSSTATSRTFSVALTPVAGTAGTGGVSLAAGDGQATVTRLVGLTVTATPTAPDAPTAVTASAATGKLNLAWTPAATGSAATSYAVYIGTSPGATTLPVQTTTATSITVTITTTGTYYARVRAQKRAGAERELAGGLRRRHRLEGQVRFAQGARRLVGPHGVDRLGSAVDWRPGDRLHAGSGYGPRARQPDGRAARPGHIVRGGGGARRHLLAARAQRQRRRSRRRVGRHRPGDERGRRLRRLAARTGPASARTVQRRRAPVVDGAGRRRCPDRLRALCRVGAGPLGSGRLQHRIDAHRLERRRACGGVLRARGRA